MTCIAAHQVPKLLEEKFTLLRYFSQVTSNVKEGRLSQVAVLHFLFYHALFSCHYIVLNFPFRWPPYICLL